MGHAQVAQDFLYCLGCVRQKKMEQNFLGSHCRRRRIGSEKNWIDLTKLDRSFLVEQQQRRQ